MHSAYLILFYKILICTDNVNNYKFQPKQTKIIYWKKRKTIWTNRKNEEKDTEIMNDTPKELYRVPITH